MYIRDTIAAISTPLGEGGIGIAIRPDEAGIATLKGIRSQRSARLRLPLRQQADAETFQARYAWFRCEPHANRYRVGLRLMPATMGQRLALASFVRDSCAKRLPPEVFTFIPFHILYRGEIPIGRLERMVGEAALFAADLWAKKQKALLPSSCRLTQEAVRLLYDRAARCYLEQHAVTSHRKDDAWRMWMAQMLLTRIAEINTVERRAADHVDAFGGTGLSYMAAAKVYHAYDVRVHTTLLDYSPGMLEVAREVTIPRVEKSGHAVFVPPSADAHGRACLRQKHPRTIELMHGNAADLTGDRGGTDQGGGLHYLQKDSIDVMSILFGIGAVSLDTALSVSAEALKVLREKGRFAITDMHMPLAALAARWPWPFPVEFRWPWFEKEAYLRVALPYVLKRVWGWHDTTLYPYLMKLSCCREEAGWFGWQELFFEVESQPWEFDIPTMPTYKQVLEKVPLSQSEAMQRSRIIEAVIKSLDGAATGRAEG